MSHPDSPVSPPVTPDAATLGEIDVRALYKRIRQKQRTAGESDELAARWFAEEFDAAIRSLASPVPASECVDCRGADPSCRSCGGTGARTSVRRQSIKTKREGEVVERAKKALEHIELVAGEVFFARLVGEGVTIATLSDTAQEKIIGTLTAAGLLASSGPVAAPAASPVQGVDATAWLIELKGDVPSYWTCEDWTPDVNRAIRFARAQDAQRVIDDFGWTEAVAVEHMWCEPRAATPQSPSTVDERVKSALECVAAGVVELYEAAQQDWRDADPADVGLGGVPIKAWREAYAEGCKDMAEKVCASLPEGHREQFKGIVLAALDAKEK